MNVVDNLYGNMLDLLKQDAKEGDSLNLYLTTGGSVNGVIFEIGENFLLMEVDGVKRRYFPQLIGGWDVVKEEPRKDIVPDSNEQSDDVEELDKEESHEEYNDVLISLFDNIYENEHVILSSNILTNAVVEKVSSTGVGVITDEGERFICHKGFMAGFSRANCTPGKRLFCGTVNATGTQKGVCFLSIMQMSFEEMRERFIQALSAKTGPRKPIINSILSYFRKNNSGKATKKVIKDLRNKLSLLGSPTKVGNSQLDKYISFKQYDKALDYISKLIDTAEDDKQKAALFLRKAQLYSSIKDFENAISAYRELITFNESINSPSKNLSHLYTELARLLLLTGDKEQAEGARNIALMLNPQNSIAKKIGGLDPNDIVTTDSSESSSSNSNEIEQNVQIVKFVDGSLIDDDIDHYSFTDSEIVSLNGEVTSDIVNRLLDSASASNDYAPHIEAAKALKSLPVGSYDIQDLEDSITNYAINKCQALFNSYKKVIIESDSLESISNEQLNKIKDCAICYSLETIENIIEDDNDAAIKLLNNSLLLELSSLLLSRKESKEKLLEILDTSPDNFVSVCMLSGDTSSISYLFIKFVDYSIQCRFLWNNLILKSPYLTSLINHVDSNITVKQAILNQTPPLKKRVANDVNFVEVLRRHESNRMKVSVQQLRKIRNTELNISSFNLLQTRITALMVEKRLRFFCDTDRKTIVGLNHIVSLLSLYRKNSKEERKNILSNILAEIDEHLSWNSGTTTTKLGRFFFCPLLVTWKEILSKHNSQSKYKNDCLLSLELESRYYYISEKNSKSFNIILFNKSSLICEGYKLAVWIGNDKKNGAFKTEEKYILPNSDLLLNIPIAQEKWGDLNIYELNFAVSSKYQGEWSVTELERATISVKRDVSFNKGNQKWHDSGNPPVEMFKGRDGIVSELREQYCSQNRRYSYVLYGLSRTGKTSILHYLGKAIEGEAIEGDNSEKNVLPLYIDLGDIYGPIDSSEKFWKLFIKTIHKQSEDFITKYRPGKIVRKPNDFNQFILAMEELNIHPLFMLDEFSYMQDIINDGYINSAFLQYMRTISADKDLASFIFAGTYDIKKLIHDPKYNISGAFTYLREPDKPLFEISNEAAEELINMMQGQLDFSPAAIRDIHRLTGNVPFWIQKLCCNCAFYAVDNNKPDIGVQDLEVVVSKMIGDSNSLSYNLTSIPSMNEGTFSKTQILDTDTPEMKIVLTSIAYLMKDTAMSDGVTYNHIKELWADKDTDILNYNIMDAIDLLCERKTLVFEDIDDSRFYKFSIGLFRRWWLHEHFEFELQLSKFKKEKK